MNYDNGTDVKLGIWKYGNFVGDKSAEYMLFNAVN